jgi:DNA-binding response OmpR family regulator
MQVTRNSTPVALTAHEFKTLEFFVQNPDRLITQAELLKKICGYENECTSSRTIDNLIMTSWRTIQAVQPTSEPYTVSGTGLDDSGSILIAVCWVDGA